MFIAIEGLWQLHWLSKQEKSDLKNKIKNNNSDGIKFFAVI